MKAASWCDLFYPKVDDLSVITEANRQDTEPLLFSPCDEMVDVPR